MTKTAEHTPGPWRQGFLIATAQVLKWPESSRAFASEHERKCVFANFETRDEGRSRVLIGKFERAEDAALAAFAPDMLAELRRTLDFEYNPFEPENQSERYKRISALVARIDAERSE